MIQDKELTIAFTIHNFSKTNSNHEPTEYEYMVVLFDLAHFGQYLAGRRSTVVTDSWQRLLDSPKAGIEAPNSPLSMKAYL